MKYQLFIDESGDHGLSNIDKDFPVFVLCGVIFSEHSYDTFKQEINKLKNELWGNKQVIFHSRDIRKCDKEFQILLDLDKKAFFYKRLNEIIHQSDFTIISASIQKEEYIKKYGKLGNVYEIALSFILERTIFYLDKQNSATHLEIAVEKRGDKEDLELSEHYNDVYSRGTYFVKPERIASYNARLRFISKRDNINGLQLADLIAYPIARNMIEPKRANLAFEVFENKFYSDGGKRYGLKQFP